MNIGQFLINEPEPKPSGSIPALLPLGLGHSKEMQELRERSKHQLYPGGEAIDFNLRTAYSIGFSIGYNQAILENHVPKELK